MTTLIAILVPIKKIHNSIYNYSMQNVISLQEIRLKKEINKAYKNLKETRTLISYGHYDKVQEALELEDTIFNLEKQLIDIIESDSL